MKFAQEEIDEYLQDVDQDGHRHSGSSSSDNENENIGFSYQEYNVGEASSPYPTSRGTPIIEEAKSSAGTSNKFGDIQQFQAVPLIDDEDRFGALQRDPSQTIPSQKSKLDFTRKSLGGDETSRSGGQGF